MLSTVVPITNVLNRRTFEIDVEYVDNDSGETKKISDTMYSVDTYVISKAERGDKLVPKFGDLVLSAYTTSKCNLGKHVQQLSKLQDGTAGCVSFDEILFFAATLEDTILCNNKFKRNSNRKPPYEKIAKCIMR